VPERGAVPFYALSINSSAVGIVITRKFCIEDTAQQN